MRKLVSMAAFAAALLSSTAATRAEEIEKWGQVAGWKINVDTTVNNGCYAIQTYSSGFVLRLGFNITSHKLYLLFGNPSWPLQPEKKYSVKFLFDDGVKFYNTEVVSKTLGSTVVLLHNNIGSEFATDFMARSNLKIINRTDGSQVANLSLSNTYAAMEAVLACQQANNNVTPATPQQMPPTPPVATNNTGPWTIALSQGDGGAHITTGKLNGSVPVTWIVDTGATFTSIPLEIAERLGAKEIRRQKFELADGRVTSESIILVDKLSVGGVVVSSNVEVAVGARGSAPLLGKNWLDRFASFEVDNKSGNLTVRK
jgi:clan AA aspartic protease (TIGR02281 family)